MRSLWKITSLSGIFLLVVMLFSSGLISSLHVKAFTDTYPYRGSNQMGSGDVWGFAQRNCTSYVAWMMNRDNGITDINANRYFFSGMRGPNGSIGSFGNASDWAGVARSIGFLVDNNPRVGDIAQYNPNEGGAYQWGHVAYVESVNGDNTVNVSEYNWNGGDGNFNQRYNVTASNYIHIKSNTNISDYNGDGIPDLWITKKFNYANIYTPGSLSVVNGGNTSSLLLNNASTIAPLGFPDRSNDIIANFNGSYAYALADYNGDGVPDLWIIKKNGYSGNVEVHILDGATRNKFLIQTKTPIKSSDSKNFAFVVGDYNRDGIPDLWAIKTSNTGTNSTEIHVLSGKDFNTYILETGTILENASTNFSFVVGDYNNDGFLDLWAIKRVGLSGATEIHVLDGKSNFKAYNLETRTALSITPDNNWGFMAGDYNKDGKLDLIVIKKNGSRGKTEMHVLNGNNFTQWLAQYETGLNSIGDDYAIAGSDRQCLVSGNSCADLPPCTISPGVCGILGGSVKASL